MCGEMQAIENIQECNILNKLVRKSG